MTNLSRSVIAYISATIMLADIATSAARADAFFYLLDNNTLAEANGGPSLVSYGGTLSQGYTFGVQQGLSLSGMGYQKGTSRQASQASQASQARMHKMMPRMTYKA
jgi:hypothetical protein